MCAKHEEGDAVPGDTSTAAPSPPLLEKASSLRSLQDVRWAAFVDDTPREWHGLWQRCGPDTSLLVESHASRAFWLADEGCEIREKNVYENPDFFGEREHIHSYWKETMKVGYIFGGEGHFLIDFSTTLGFEMF